MRKDIGIPFSHIKPLYIVIAFAVQTGIGSGRLYIGRIIGMLKHLPAFRSLGVAVQEIHTVVYVGLHYHSPVLRYDVHIIYCLGLQYPRKVMIHHKEKDHHCDDLHKSYEQRYFSGNTFFILHISPRINQLYVSPSEKVNYTLLFPKTG